jgi:sigma-E factor negative regulatory protein RseA
MTKLNPSPEPESAIDDHLSALMDSALIGEAKQSAVELLLTSSAARSTWHTYHVVGDVLRSDDLADAAHDMAFLAKLEASLAVEPQRQWIPHPNQTISATRFSADSANGGAWRVVAGVACAALVAAIGITAWLPGAAPSATQLAEAPMLPPVAAQTVVADGMIRDPRLDQLLSAHQQLGGHSALQMPSGFLRNATYEGSGR